MIDKKSYYYDWIRNITRQRLLFSFECVLNFDIIFYLFRVPIVYIVPYTAQICYITLLLDFSLFLSDLLLKYSFDKEVIFSNNIATQLRNTTPLIVLLY